MKYEVSNIVFRRKPSDGQMKKKYPFRRGKEQVHLVEDTTRNLYLTYSRGFSIKPHPFTEETLSSAKVHCIVLDFDHLTANQKDFVEAIVKGKYQFKGIYGDYSAGTKTRLYENRDIPNYEPPKWGFKVFYPADCLCVWKELNEAFIEAVSFFNPIFTKEQAREVWDKWVKANNRKDKIDDPIFKDWILPDVAMLNSYRTQITYGVRPELEEDYKVKEFPKDDIYTTFAFPSGGKDDYKGLEWRPEEVIQDKPIDDKVADAWRDKVIEVAWRLEFANALENPDDLKLLLPTAKSVIARRLKKQTFEDLVWDEKANAILNARLYARTIDFDIAKQVASETATTLTRNLLELETQRNINPSFADAIKNNIHALCHDILVVVRQRCGLTILKKKQGILDDLLKTIARRIIEATNNFSRHRARLKMKHFEQVWNPPHLQLLRDYLKTQDKSLLATYNTQRAIWIKEHILETQDLKMPYTYKKKGLKKWLIATACLDLTIEELKGFGLEPSRLESVEEWIDWSKKALSRRQDDLNDVSDDDLKRWYAFYRREFNAKWGNLDQKIDKRCGEKSSKYDDKFRGKSKEEIADIIDHLDVSRGRKSQLRKRWL